MSEAVVSWASSPAVRKSMQGNRSRDTSPELAVRRALHAMGLRYRVAARPLPGLRRTADIVFRPARVAVFVDGCFWHGCPEHYVPPSSNTDYWLPKISRNQERDRETTTALEAAGWLVLRYWEHQPAAVIVHEIAANVAARRNARTPSSNPGAASAPLSAWATSLRSWLPTRIARRRDPSP